MEIDCNSFSTRNLRDINRNPILLPDVVNLVGAGLWNHGKTCYLNAVLQCIIHTVPMLEKLRYLDQFHSCNHEEEEERGSDYFCSLRSLRDLSKKSLTMSGRAISPFAFTRNLSKISVEFVLGHEEDAHEFLHSLLDHLHSCCINIGHRDNPLLVMNKDSLIKDIYGGRLVSTLRCSECGHCSDTFEPLLDLSLEVTEACTLNDALESFTKSENIEEAMFACEGCKTRVSMVKQTKIDRAPAVASIHLKRFQNDGVSITKIHSFVEFPLELDLKPFIGCPEDGVETVYDLYAVLVHIGEDCDGHYYCYIRSGADAWHLMDDCNVRRVHETDVLQERAYILFYIKKGLSPWFSSYAESLKGGFYLPNTKKSLRRKGESDRIRFFGRRG